MPVYVYRCLQCGANLERRQSFTDDPLTVCETCSGELRRVVQPVAVVYKGTGFYTTDYKNAPKPEDKPKLKQSGEDHPHQPSEYGDSSESTKPSATPSTPTSDAPATSTPAATTATTTKTE